MGRDLFKFKSSGRKQDAREINNIERISPPSDIGIKTPVTNRQGKAFFDTHSTVEDQLRDNMRNFIMTNFGERLGLPNFGANLYQLLFDYTSKDNFIELATRNIIQGAATFLPTVDIDNVEVLSLDRSEKFDVNKKSMAKVKLRVTFGVPQAQISNLAVDVILQTGG